MHRFSKGIQPVIFAWMPFFCYSALVVFISSCPDPIKTQLVPGADKVIHFLEFGVYYLLCLRFFSSFKKLAKCNNDVIIALIFSFLFALSDEIHQMYVMSRDSSMYDLLADYLGIVLSMGIVKSNVTLKNKFVTKNDKKEKGNKNEIS